MEIINVKGRSETDQFSLQIETSDDQTYPQANNIEALFTYNEAEYDLISVELIAKPDIILPIIEYIVDGSRATKRFRDDKYDISGFIRDKDFVLKLAGNSRGLYYKDELMDGIYRVAWRFGIDQLPEWKIIRYAIAC